MPSNQLVYVIQASRKMSTEDLNEVQGIAKFRTFTRWGKNMNNWWKSSMPRKPIASSTRRRLL